MVLKSLSAKPSKWSNTLKQFGGKLPTNRLSVFVCMYVIFNLFNLWLALKGLNVLTYILRDNYVNYHTKFHHQRENLKILKKSWKHEKKFVSVWNFIGPRYKSAAAIDNNNLLLNGNHWLLIPFFSHEIVTDVLNEVPADTQGVSEYSEN